MPPRQKIRPLSWTDRDALLAEAASDRRHYALFATLVKARLRPGESFALRPEDIDFKNQTLRVERAATDDGQVKDTKTHETRTVDLTPDVVAMLKRHLTWLSAEALPQGTGEPEWLFPRADGTLMNNLLLAESAPRRSRTSRRNWGTRARPRPCGSTRAGSRARERDWSTRWVGRRGRA